MRHEGSDVSKRLVGAWRFELRDLLRPRQARYQAALRPDMKCVVNSKALPSITPNPSRR